MSGERDDRLREERREHPQVAALGGAGDFDLGPESVEERAAREGAPQVEGPSLDELIEREANPVATSFTRDALAEHDAAEEERAASASAPEESSA